MPLLSINIYANTRTALGYAVCCLCLCTGVVNANDEQPWGVYLADAVPSAPIDPKTANDGVNSHTSPASALTVATRLEQIQEELDSRILRVGPYAPVLAETLLSAAREAEGYGALDAALELYKKALFNIRVNEGLSAPAQLVVLERMLNIQRERGDPKALIARLDYYYHLFGRGAPPFTTDKLTASVRWLDVNVELLAAEDLRTQAARFAEVWSHGEDLHGQVCGDIEWSREFCKPITLKLLALLYLLDYHIDPLVSTESGLTGTSRSNFEREWATPPSEQRLRTIERSASSKGLALLEEAAAIRPDDLELLLARADWRWFGGNRASALELYRLVRDRDPSALQSAVPLPAFPRIQRDPRLVEQVFHLEGEAVISSYGRPKDLTVLPHRSAAESSGHEGAEPGNLEATATGAQKSERAMSVESEATDQDALESALRFARNQLRDIRFRPVLNAEGEPIETRWQASFLLLRR